MDRAAYLLLDNLAERPRSVRSLADDLHLDHSTVTRQVAALLDRDLAQRVADPEGGRATVLELTRHGRRQLSTERTSRAERVGITLRSWSDRDRNDLARLLVQLNSSIDDRLRNPGHTGT
jgi:DNA-binding MarR family transcriptional regulator